MTESEDGSIVEPSMAVVINELMLGEPTVHEVLERVLHFATSLIEGVDGASITLYRPDHKPFTTVATSDWVREVDAQQYRTQQGPCIEVAATSAPTTGSADLGESSSWPVFGPIAADLGVHAVLAAGLCGHPDPTNPSSPPGALNLYARRPFAFSAREREQVLILAAIAGAGARLAAARTDAARLREALSSRDVIGQAKGVLRERHGISEDEAFAILRRASNDLNVKLRDVAAQVANREGCAAGSRAGGVPDGAGHKSRDGHHGRRSS